MDFGCLFGIVVALIALGIILLGIGVSTQSPLLGIPIMLVGGLILWWLNKGPSVG